MLPRNKLIFLTGQDWTPKNFHFILFFCCLLDSQTVRLPQKKLQNATTSCPVRLSPITKKIERKSKTQNPNFRPSCPPTMPLENNLILSKSKTRGCLFSQSLWYQDFLYYFQLFSNWFPMLFFLECSFIWGFRQFRLFNCLTEWPCF